MKIFIEWFYITVEVTHSNKQYVHCSFSSFSASLFTQEDTLAWSPAGRTGGWFSLPLVDEKTESLTDQGTYTSLFTWLVEPKGCFSDSQTIAQYLVYYAAWANFRQCLIPVYQEERNHSGRVKLLVHSQQLPGASGIKFKVISTVFKALPRLAPPARQRHSPPPSPALLCLLFASRISTHTAVPSSESQNVCQGVSHLSNIFKYKQILSPTNKISICHL